MANCQAMAEAMRQGIGSREKLRMKILNNNHIYIFFGLSYFSLWTNPLGLVFLSVQTNEQTSSVCSECNMYLK
jgi:hypothetical protein